MKTNCQLLDFRSSLYYFIKYHPLSSYPKYAVCTIYEFKINVNICFTFQVFQVGLRGTGWAHGDIQWGRDQVHLPS